MLLAGIRRLALERGHLDRINVFPVPDGDTGTNLTLTFSAIADCLADMNDPPCGELMAAAASAALDGARGNSGAIFAQYFQGLADTAAGLERLGPRDIGRMLATGASYAHSALDDPRDGTVLTVMRAMAAAVAPEKLADPNDFGALFPALLDAARAAVEDTRTTLEVMRAAGVADAGAVGMLLLLEGMTDGLAPGTGRGHRLRPDDAADDGLDGTPDGPDGGVTQRSHGGASAGELPDHRYCTECLVTGDSMDHTRLREELTGLDSSSVVVVGSRRKLRVHAHVDLPELVFGIARGYGAVSAEKADDMVRQERSLLGAGARVAIVTDSGADLPDELWDEFGVQLVPLRVTFGDRSYLDKAGMSSADFFRELRRNPELPRTSQPPPGDFRRAYELLSSHFEHVVSLSLSSRLSGSHQAALAAAGRISRPDQVTVVDTCSASVGQGLVALAAAEHAHAGLTHEELLAVIRDCIGNTRAYGFVPDLSYAVRGGRLPDPWRWLAARLPLSFVVSIDSVAGLRVRRVMRRGRPGASRIDALLRAALRDARPGASHRIAIAHGDSPQDAARLAEACRARLPGVGELVMTELGPVLGAHGGPGTLALAVQEYPVPRSA